MRSHLINNNSATESDHHEKLISSSSKSTKLSVVPLNNGSGTKTTSTSPTCFEAAGYGLRENPKKTWRIADSSEDTNSLPDKSCKECGKGFQSWKALFGHMKCHSDFKERNSNSLEDQEHSWTSGNQKVVMDSQSDNETAAPNRRRRSRRRTRYMGVTATSSSFSIPTNPSSSVSETEQEQQEEIALCLMMLSRDAGNWGGVALKSVAESSDNSSVFLEAPSRITIVDAKNSSSLCHGKSEALKFKKLNAKDVCASSGFISKKLLRMKQAEVSSIDGFFKKDKIKKSKVSESYLGKKADQFDEAHLGSIKFNSSKRKNDHELRSDSLKKLTTEAHKGSKFECTTCNKIFHSYQALGGHRASHKKIKGCFASKIESSENSIENDVSPDPIITAESKPSKNCKVESFNVDHEMADQTSHVKSSKKSKGHKCPICLKVFSSGQALGGHKRSHLIGSGGGSEAKNNQTIVIQKPIPEIRDFLDLNLPAPVEEDSNGGGHNVASLKSWWVGSCSHKHEGLVGLISN